jgi:ERCC4-type nuclease
MNSATKYPLINKKYISKNVTVNVKIWNISMTKNIHVLKYFLSNKVNVITKKYLQGVKGKGLHMHTYLRKIVATEVHVYT